MLTYQDLLEVPENNLKARLDFVKKAIDDHKRSEAYQIAFDAEEYFKNKNTTIINFQKMLYTISGKAVPDNWSANYKMSSHFFRRFVIHEVQYLLGNGVSWTNKATEGKISNEKYPFDSQLQKLGKKALTMGCGFGFFNVDHIEVFDFLEFVPLYDEENGALSSGIRYWRIAPNKPLRATLYEKDGYTDYIWRNGEEGAILHEKRAYILKVQHTEADGTEIYDQENYPDFPIVPMWGNSDHISEFVGLKEQIDCYDLIKSGFANTVDEASIVYWTLTNAGGMDNIDLAKFVQKLKTVHAATLEDQAQAQSHVIDPPFASREALLQRLEKDLYKDAMALNTEAIASGAVTATQIKAAYEPLNSKVDDFEFCVINFIKGILKLAGIEDEPTFTRSGIANASEEIQNVIQSANYLDEEYVTRKILDILGDGDQADRVLERKDAENMERFNDQSTDYEDEDEEENEQQEDNRRLS